MNVKSVKKGKCKMCGKHASEASLFLDEGNDFYFCPDCDLMFCEDCLGRLPLTGNPGYAMCPNCKVRVKRSAASVLDPSYEGEVMARFVDSVNAEAKAGKRKAWWQFWK